MKTIKFLMTSLLCAVFTFMIGSCTDSNKVQDPADKAALEIAITSAENILKDATVGDQPGNYPQAATNALSAAIDAAKAVNNDKDATQEEVDSATEHLNAAVDAFKGEVVPVPDVDKTALDNAVKAAETLVNAAVEGSASGQYPKAAIDEFKTAIATAKEVLNDEGKTQSQVNAAVTALNEAQTTFEAAKVVINKDALVEAITAAQAVVDAAVVGTEPGQYPQDAIDTFKAAIAAANAVKDNAAAIQNEIDAAVTALNEAKTAFESAKIEEKPTPSEKDPVLYLPFSGNAEDMSVMKHVVTLVPGANSDLPILAADRMGAAEQAYAFNGGYMTVAYNSVLAPKGEDGNLTVMYWICQKEPLNSNAAVVSMHWWDNYYGCVNYEGESNAEIGFVAGGATVLSGVHMENGVWYHVVMTRSASAMKLYVNGELKAEQTDCAPMNGEPGGWEQPLVIGSLQNGTGANPFHGSIDELKVYNAILSETEIADIYDTERP